MGAYPLAAGQLSSVGLASDLLAGRGLHLVADVTASLQHSFLVGVIAGNSEVLP